jgi:hypothetical protein
MQVARATQEGVQVSVGAPQRSPVTTATSSISRSRRSRPGSGASPRRSRAICMTPMAVGPAGSRTPTAERVRVAAPRRAAVTGQAEQRRCALRVLGARRASGARSASKPRCAHGGGGMAGQPSARTSPAATRIATAVSIYADWIQAGRVDRGQRSASCSITSARFAEPTQSHSTGQPSRRTRARERLNMRLRVFRCCALSAAGVLSC